MIYATSFEIYILYQQINLARDFLLTTSLIEISITRSSILNLFETKIVMLLSDQNAHDLKNNNSHY